MRHHTQQGDIFLVTISQAVNLKFYGVGYTTLKDLKSTQEGAPVCVNTVTYRRDLVHIA